MVTALLTSCGAESAKSSSVEDKLSEHENGIVNTDALKVHIDAESEGIFLSGASELENTASEYADMISLLEKQHELETYMETVWERKEGLDTWEDFEEYAQSVYTKEYVDCFFTPKYFGLNSAYYYLDEQGQLCRMESDGIVDSIKSNSLWKMAQSENNYAAVQKLDTDDEQLYRIYQIIKTDAGFRIYSQIEFH